VDDIKEENLLPVDANVPPPTPTSACEAPIYGGIQFFQDFRKYCIQNGCRLEQVVFEKENIRVF